MRPLPTRPQLPGLLSESPRPPSECAVREPWYALSGCEEPEQAALLASADRIEALLILGQPGIGPSLSFFTLTCRT